MPKVPYVPYPTAEPTSAGTPDLHVGLNEAAFGGTVARALEGAGRGLEHAGDELFNRAVAMQQIQNKAEADEADANFMSAAGDLHAEYGAKRGKDAVDALPKFKSDLIALRKKFADGMSSDQAKKMFDSASLSTVGRTIFNAAGHAATENKAWAAGASEARVKEIENYALHYPDDDVAFARGLRSAESEIRGTQGPLAGWGPEQTKLQVDARVSRMWAARIQGMADHRPFEAKEMFEANKDKLFGADLEKTKDLTDTRINMVGSRQISSQVNRLDKDGEQRPLEEVVTEARRLAKEHSDDPVFMENVLQRTESDYRINERVRQDTERRNVNTVGDVLIDGINGRIPTNPDDLRADPKAAAAYDALPAPKRKAVNAALAKNAKGDVPETPQTIERLAVLKGMANEKPADFMDINVFSEDLPLRDKKTLRMLQETKRKDARADPQVSRALGWLRPMLESAKVTYRDDAERYYKFVGDLQDAIVSHQEQTKKAPNFEETQAIGSRLLQTTPDKNLNWFYRTFSADPRFFELSVPKEAEDIIRSDPTWASRGIVPTDEDIRRIFITKKYQKTWGKSGGEE
jgi:hypothetical protein